MKVQVLYCARVELTMLALNYVIEASVRISQETTVTVKTGRMLSLCLIHMAQILEIGRGRSPFYARLA